MSAIRKLAGQTAIYGLSSILGRLFNYLLVPLHTRVFLTGQYGEVTKMYAYVSFLIVLFSYGMETAYFRFAQQEKDNPKVYSTSLISLLASSVGLAAIFILFSGAIAGWIGDASMPLHPEYVSWFGCILALDAISYIPFARLRRENKATRFVSIKVVWIISNVFFNVYFLLWCKHVVRMPGSIQDPVLHISYPDLGVGYVFIANLIASSITLLLLTPEIFRIKFDFDKELWRKMIVYALPLMIMGTAGMVNETFDRILLPKLLTDKSTALAELGIYGACYKLSIIMTLFVQTFRYAAEPFFFEHSGKDNAKQTYANVMHYFIITCAVIFLGIMMYMDVVKYFIGKSYWGGLKIVPILLLANLCLGVFFNLSIWYKLSGHTRWGAFLAVFGAVITLILLFWWIPLMGYMGAAWATLVCYASMMVLSYIIGQKYYPVDYNLSSFVKYIGVSVLFYFFSEFLRNHFEWTKGPMLIINSFLMIAFLLLIFVTERDKIPYLYKPLNKGIRNKK